MTQVLDPAAPVMFLGQTLVEIGTIVRKTLFLFAVAGAALVSSGCEPASLTEAHDQLARGPADTVRYILPIVQDTVDVSDLDVTNDTVIGDLRAVEFDPESVAVAVGEELRFEAVTLTRVAVTFPPAVFSAPAGTVVDTTVAYPTLTTEPRLQAIDTVLVRAGTLQLVTRNRLVEPLSYTITLRGFLTPGGSPLTRSAVVPGAPGNGSYAANTLTVSLAGVRIIPDSAVARIDASVTLSGSPLDPVNADSAIVQTGTASFEVEALSGSLDPSVTPELSVAVEDAQEIPASAVDFGDFEDAVRASTLNTAQGTLTFTNQAQAPVVLSGFTVGAVQLTLGGGIPRNPVTGEPLYEQDGQGNPILVPVTDPGQATLAIARAGMKSVTIPMAALVDRVVHLLLDDRRVAIIGAGTATAGDGQPSRVERNDSVTVRIELVVGLDVTLPDTGVVVRENRLGDGMDLEQKEADDLVHNLMVQAVATAIVENGTPYALEALIAYAADSLGDIDVAGHPGAVLLAPILVAAPSVDASGRVTAPVVDTVEIVIDTAAVRPLLGTRFTSTIRTRLLAASGGAGRAALGANDRALLRVSAGIDVKRGGGR